MRRTATKNPWRTVLVSLERTLDCLALSSLKMELPKLTFDCR